VSSIEERQIDMVRKLCKDGQIIKNEMSGEKWNAISQAMTAFIEAGNHLDTMKKLAIYNKSGIPHDATPARVPDATAEQYHMLHMAIGIAGESAELLENIQHYFKTGNWDHENVLEEMGDLEFYMEGFRQGGGINRLRTLMHNLDKLAVRYENYDYSDQAAHDRADKREVEER
jgi:hypothetical protein